MLSQQSGGSVVSITSSIVDHPLAVFTASVPMITKGGIDAISRSLAMEYAKQSIRVNVVAPGVVDTPLHKNNPKDFLRTLSPLGQIAASKDIAEAVFYLTEASQVTGEVLHVDGGAHLGRWQVRTNTRLAYAAWQEDDGLALAPAPSPSERDCT
jgi:NAD(P)-dependent dehydrogenase (short-subunit alcohol dehydrogenase family)